MENPENLVVQLLSGNNDDDEWFPTSSIGDKRGEIRKLMISLHEE
jgi:hypothetical protein